MRLGFLRDDDLVAELLELVVAGRKPDWVAHGSAKLIPEPRARKAVTSAGPSEWPGCP
jgi:hypothetical protein